jgi:hypothetical protein
MFTSGAPVSDNTGSKCKIICRIKISAFAGMTCLEVALNVTLNSIQGLVLKDSETSSE